MSAKCVRLILLLLPALCAQAQESTFTGAATHPGQGQLYSRALFMADDNDEYEAHVRLAYGIISRMALVLDGHHEWLSDESDYSSLTARLKYRVLQRDFGPINTWRASIVGGVEFPEYDDPAPHLGAVTTAIINRHGLNGQIDWAGYASDPDEFMVNASHLYRLSPAKYRIDTKGAWYTQLEWLNTIYDNGDYEMYLAPGLLYEARSWAAETGIRLPVAEEGNTADADITVAAGLRYLF
ncbi:MAG: hypothetical protein KJN98_05300 [Pontiella sp.]|nr:hypothetical protein [Pontiella sp.]